MTRIKFLTNCVHCLRQSRYTSSMNFEYNRFVDENLVDKEDKEEPSFFSVFFFDKHTCRMSSVASSWRRSARWRTGRKCSIGMALVVLL